jgi:hypothetical protein
LVLAATSWPAEIGKQRRLMEGPEQVTDEKRKAG